jgi:hypothetical protein
MPNPRWNNMHGANDKSGGGASNKAPGTAPKVNLGAKQKDRSGGTAKRGPLGPFHVKSEGL